MQSDLPHTLYIRDKGGKGKKGNKKVTEDFRFNPNDPAMAKQMEAIRKRRNKEKSYTTDELFK